MDEPADPAPAEHEPVGPARHRPAGDGRCYPGSGAGNPRARPRADGARGAGPRPALDPTEGEDWSALRRVGLYGGSFDPVHVGHLHVAAQAQAARALERVVFVPAGQSPHKREARLASGPDRVAMLALALRGHPSWRIDGLELERAGPSFTLDTLRAIRARWGLAREAQLFLLLGSDNLELFPRWRGAAELLELAEPIVVPRQDDLEPIWRALREAAEPALLERLARAVVPGEVVRVASREIRAALERGAPLDGLLPAGVAEYIAARGIYGAGRGGAPSGAARPPG